MINYLKKRMYRFCDKYFFKFEKNKVKCILSAIKEQDLFELYNKLNSIVPDIKNQYSSFQIDSEYLNVKVRAQHSFQISIVIKSIEELNLQKEKEITIVDIGDSAGTHIKYLKSLIQNVRSLSINLDNKAVERIKQNGLEAIQCRAEEVEKYDINPDIFICFQTVEHLHSPIQFF